MIRLIRVEIARMTARRLNRLLVMIVMALLVLAGVLTFFNSSEDLDRPAALAEAQRERRAFVEECVRSGGAPGEHGPGEPGLEGQGPTPAQCDAMIPPAEELIQDKRFQYAGVADGLVGVSFQFILAMVVIGASAMGAEWNNRTVTTTLTWEPRRSRVFAAKVAACAAVVFTLLIVLLAWVMLVLLPSGLWRGTMEGVTWAWAADVAEIVLRISALGALASVLALAVATVGRSTAASLGVVFGYVAIVESLVRGFRPGWQTWLLGNNIGVTVLGQTPGYDPERTVLGALVIVLAYAAVVVGGAWRFFKHADIG